MIFEPCSVPNSEQIPILLVSYKMNGFMENFSY